MAQTQILDVSGGMQTATTWQLRKSNEVYDAENMRFDQEIGGSERRLGHTLVKNFSDTYPLGSFPAEFSTGDYIFYAYNDAAANPTATILSYYDPSDDSSHVVKNDYPKNCKLSFVMNADELYVAGITTDTGARQSVINITNTFAVSTSRNLYTCPKAAFIGENSGALYAMNVEVDGVVHADRAYISSPQRGAMTYVNAAMSNTLAPVDLVNQVPPMTSATAPSGVVSGSGYLAGYDPWHAFDRSTDATTGRWITAANVVTGWLKYDFGAGNGKIIKYYDIKSAGPYGSINRNPKTWTLQGSNDDSNWTTIDTQTNVAAWTSVSEVRTYITSNTTSYRYYKLDITANQGATDAVSIDDLKLYSTIQTVTEYQVKVDSARYVKVGMEIDIYKAGTSTKLYTLTPTSVDTSKDTFNFLPYSLSATAGTNDIVTVSDTTNFPTGTPILFKSTGTAPAGLVVDTTYYVININATTFKVAASYTDSLIGSAIDITGTGTGVHTVFMNYIMAKTDELWLHDRHDDPIPSLFWNTDYRSPQTADFLFIQSGKTASTSISGWAKSNNRLNIFTTSSMWQYDNANFLPIFLDIGCISHDTICNNGTFIIWLDATGKVRARDSNSGQDQIISRAIRNQYLENLTSTNLLNSSAVMHNGNYKLNVGQMSIAGVTKYTRFIYNFDMNIWWREAYPLNHNYSFVSSYSGVAKCYFFDQVGNLQLDETGNLDGAVSIPWFIQYGRRNLGVSQTKTINGFYVFGTNLSHATGSVFMVKTPGLNQNWRTVGQLTSPITSIEVPDTNPLEAQDFDFKIAGNSKGEPARIEGIEVWSHVQQANFS